MDICHSKWLGYHFHQTFITKEMVWFSEKKKMFKENVSANFSTFLKNGKIKNENISSDPFSSLDGALNTYIHTPITKQWQ